MADRKGYMIRTQGHGIHHERVFLQYPDESDVAAALESEIERHGLDRKTGEERERWAKVIEVEIVDRPARAKAKAHMTGIHTGEPRTIDEPVTQGEATPGDIVMHGEGVVTNPESKK